MTKDRKLIEITIQKLLKFMQYEAEKHGRNIKSVVFNFTPKFTQYFFGGHKPEEVPEGEDLTTLKELLGIEEDILLKAIKAAIVRKYLRNVGYYPSVKEEYINREFSLFLVLTNDGYQEAMFIDPNILDEDQKDEESESNLYYHEKSKGGKKRHEKTTVIKNNIIKLMFLNKDLIKGKTIQQRADNIEKKLTELFDIKNDEEKPYSEKEMSKKLSEFAILYQLDHDVLESAKDYFEGDRSERIYKWCLEFGKEDI